MFWVYKNSKNKKGQFNIREKYPGPKSPIWKSVLQRLVKCSAVVTNQKLQ